MKQLLKLLSIAFFTLIASCAMINKTPVTVPKSQECAILPFSNLSDTPLAGERVAAILYGVLKSKGYRTVLFFTPREKDYTEKEIENLRQKAKEKFNCVIEGSVNEWRYKAGIDGEPAVSITYIVENDGKTFSGTISGSDWGHKSLGLLTQELFNKTF